MEADLSDEPEDLQGCEHCSKEFPIEDMTMMDDGWFCAECCAEWKAEFDACAHSWEPEESEFGEPGKYCGKCHGFVLDKTEAA
jgi:uncharacterized Zn ribbon protein